METEQDVPWTRVAAFIRQHTHDVRNGLNSLDLETSLLRELVPEGEAREGVERLRKQLRVLAEQMRSLSGYFQNLKPFSAVISARDLLEIWREKHADLASPPDVTWADELGDERVNVDPEMMATVFRELLMNAAAFTAPQPLAASARASDGEILYELREPKNEELDPTNWGEPFLTSRRGGYGLGLWNARRLLAVNNARIEQQYLAKDSVILTRIALPVV